MRHSVLWNTVRFGTVGMRRILCVFYRKEPALGGAEGWDPQIQRDICGKTKQPR